MLNLHKEILHYLAYCSNEKSLSKHTIKAYSIDLMQFQQYKFNTQFDRNCIGEYIRLLHSNYKPKTIRRKIASLKAFAHYLYYNDKITSNPFDKIDTTFKEPLILPKTIPANIINSILTASHKNIKQAKSKYKKDCAIRNTAVIELLFASGARISEICSLRQNDIDIINHTIKIFGKGSRERIIQIENMDVLSILRKYIRTFSSQLQNSEYLFINNRGSRFSEQSVRNVIKNLENQIHSYMHITPHMFRHSVATLLLEEDVDIRYIQRILGHSSITTTQIYTHVTSSKQKEILRTKHPRNKMHIS